MSMTNFIHRKPSCRAGNRGLRLVSGSTRAARPSGWGQSLHQMRVWLLLIAFAAFIAVLAVPEPSSSASLPEDELQADFALCGRGPRETCVVDGDTLWFAGTKIRVADIDAPEVSTPACANEARLGAAATQRFTALLNGGAFSLESDPASSRDTDRYGRALRLVTRGGESLGAVLVDEGLAEEWNGPRVDWC
jgi:micrococcal nuclease